jgi:CTP:molybdopterin cytidylyltransferase MocA
MPVWEPALFEALESRRTATKAQAIAPSNDGRKGHPLLLRGDTISSISGLDARHDRLDVWLRGQNVEVVDTPWPCVLENWNAGVPA